MQVDRNKKKEMFYFKNSFTEKKLCKVKKGLDVIFKV